MGGSCRVWWPLFLVSILAIVTGCKDPPGDTGGLVLVIRTFEAAPGTEFADIERIVVGFDQVELIHRDTIDGDERIIVVDDQPRTIELSNENSGDTRRDTVVGNYHVPVGFVVQARIRPTNVLAYFRDGRSLDLPVDNPTLPSWSQSGWKISADNGTLFPILTDELTGMRGLMRFADRFVRPQNPNGLGLKIKPTIDAELFAVNPENGEPGLFLDQLVVVLKPGVPATALDTINAEIRAVVLRAPLVSQAYRVKFPPPVTIRDAYAFYARQPEVQGVLPMARFRLLATPDDAGQPAHGIAGLSSTSWGFVEAAVGTVGTSRVQIAMVEAGHKVAHPEIALNMEINQGELPLRLFDLNGNGVVDGDDIIAADTDGDGMITFYDLNSSAFTIPRPADINSNGIADAEDLIQDSNWADGVDDDDFDRNPNTFKDDLVGWDFEHNDRNVAPNGTDNIDVQKHGTLTTQVAAGIGDNGVGIAGAAWRVSVVPIKGALTTDEFVDVSAYVEQRGVPILNASFGIPVTSKLAVLDGAVVGKIETGVPQDDFDRGIAIGIKAFETLPWIDPDLGIPASRTLYVMAAGNEELNIGQAKALFAPAEFLQAVIPGQVLLVGNAVSATRSDPSSNYGFVGPPPMGVNIWAPGTWNVIPFEATDPANLPDAVTENGSSLSAPCISGIAALLFSRFPTMTPADVHDRLINTASNRLDVFIDGNQKATNQPLVNACRALATTLPEETECQNVIGP